MTGARLESAAEQRDHGQAVLGLFDAVAPHWSAKYAPNGALASRLVSMTASVGRYVQSGDKLLDLGCGTGELTRALARRGVRATGCDISREMLQRAAREPSDCADWVQLELGWTRLPFESSMFDAVVAASVLEYVVEPAAVLRECARVLRPGGVVLCTVPDLRHPVRWAEWFARMLTALVPAPTLVGSTSRPNRYRVYLRASQQHHRVSWWTAASSSAWPASGAVS